jgi:enamine deaminase RidA (YjgF/YER057c/UK114 family)
MTTNSTAAEDRLAELGIHLPDAPTPFGAYVPTVQTGNLLFLSGMLAASGHTDTVVGIVGKDLDVKAGREAAYTAALNVLALTKKQLGSLNRVSHVVRLGVYVAATPEFTEHPRVADAASELLRDVFGGRDRLFAPCLLCCEPSTRFAGRAGSHLGSEELTQPTTRGFPAGK